MIATQGRAYVEFRGPDEDGGDAITVALFSYRTTEQLSKKLLQEENSTKGPVPTKKVRGCYVRACTMPDA